MENFIKILLKNETKNKEMYRTRGTRRRKRIDAFTAAEHHSIRHRVSLLKHIGNEQRQCKCQQKFYRAALRHIANHKIAPFKRHFDYHYIG